MSPISPKLPKADLILQKHIAHASAVKALDTWVRENVPSFGELKLSQSLTVQLVGVARKLFKKLSQEDIESIVREVLLKLFFLDEQQIIIINAQLSFIAANVRLFRKSSLYGRVKRFFSRKSRK